MNKERELQPLLFFFFHRFISSRYTHYQDLNEAVARIRKSNGQFAAIVEGKDAEYVVRRNCDLLLLREKLFTMGYGIACPKGVTGERLCANISTSILSLYEDGTIHMIYQKWWESNLCTETAEDAYVSGAYKSHIPFRVLAVSDLAFAFLMLLVGTLICLMALGGEIVYHMLRRTDKVYPTTP